MRSFNYHKPDTLDAALALLSGNDEALPIAGGMTLLPTMKQRLAAPEDLVDLSGLPGLADVAMEGDILVIGAMTRHADVAASPLVKEKLPALANLASRIGDQQVRHRGTIGGSISNNDPAADYPAAVLALNAEIVTSKRTIAADDFFTDLFETALAEDELVTGVDFPIAEAAAYVKFTNQASRFALVGVFIARRGDAVRVAVTGAGPSVFRVEEMERALAGNFNAKALVGISVAADGLNTDLHAGAEYRAHLINVLARRAVTEMG